MVISVAVECGLGTRPHDSLAREEVQALEKMRVAWKPPEENSPLLIDKNHPTCPPENHVVLDVAAIPLNKYYDNEDELHLSDMRPLGAPRPRKYPLLLPVVPLLEATPESFMKPRIMKPNPWA